MRQIDRVQKLALILDCDGVLVNSEEIVQTIELDLLAAIGLHYERDDFSRRFLGTSDEHFFAGLSADAEAKLGHPLPASFPESLRRRAREAFETELRAFEGVTRLLDEWHGQLAVASSSSIPALQNKLALAGIASFFGEHVYSADHVDAGKPNPAIYRYTATRLNVHPAACIVVEDSINGVHAAKAAGMYTVGFTGGGHCLPDHKEGLMEAGADHVADSMDGIHQHLFSEKSIR